MTYSIVACGPETGEFGGAVQSRSFGAVRCVSARAGVGVVATQANMMASDRVWPAMAEAFRVAAGTLAQRLLAAMDAAQAEGGDWRGQQAAALLVVAAQASGRPWDDLHVDVRVHDSEQPLVELRRLVGIAEYHRRIRSGSGITVAEAVAGAAAAGLAEQDVLWAGVVAGAETDRDEWRRYLERLLAREPRFAEVVRRRRALARAYGIEPVEGAP